MKKLLLLIALIFPFSVSATGIPVVDVASLTQMVTDNLAKAKQWGLEAQQWAKQNGMDIDQYKEALKQGKDIYEQGEHYKKMVDGHFNFEDVLNDPLANEFYDLEEWRDVYDELEEGEKGRGRRDGVQK